MTITKIWKCIVADDEPLAREVLCRYIERVPSLQLAAECSNAIEVMETLKQTEVDIIFLDIQMPEILGTDLIRILHNPPSIILTTAFQEYALEGFELDVVDYLLKPITFERFLKAVAKVSRLHGKETDSFKLPTPAPGEAAEPYLYFRTDRKTVKVLLHDVLYIEGMGNYVKVFTQQGTIITKNSLTTIEAMLPEGPFLRIHRSYIVSRDRITSFSHEVVEINKVEIPIGKLYKSQVLKTLNR
jgi:DNA-binding LytR/AlgR family response regulator